MKIHKARFMNSLVWILLLLMMSGANVFAADTISQEHDEHSHGNHEGHNDSDYKQSEAGHGDFENELHKLEVELSPKAVELAGIKLDKVKSIKMAQAIELAGEVDFDQERVAHVVPRFPGIVIAAEKKVGDFVEAGTVLASVESNESLNKYQVKSLISGTIIEKHITLGEFVSEGNTIYVIADLSQVWINLEAYAKDAEHLRLGQRVKIECIGHEHRAEGEIAYIKPVYSEQTRSLIARIILSNPAQQWRPGAFVKGVVLVESDKASTVVLKDAIQTVQEKTYVFVPEKEKKNVFQAVEVTIGKSDNQYVQVLSGVLLEDTYVSKGAFELKAELATSSLTGHAGHGH